MTKAKSKMKTPPMNRESSVPKEEQGRIFRCFEKMTLDTTTIPQYELDIANKVRTNLFPWRGQFSPQLIEILLKTYCKPDNVILDPFVGVGTTIYEAARHGLSAIGTEINPAAYEMANTAIFISHPIKRREESIAIGSKILNYIVSSNMPLFGSTGENGEEIIAPLVIEISHATEDHCLRNILINTLIRFVEAKVQNSETLLKSFDQHVKIILSLPFQNRQYEVYQADARAIPIHGTEVDLVITSPPYINVFNYHQNCRKTMELLGWDLLEVAKSEFGSNRKNRGNRVLTVIQYCLDMAETFEELARVVKDDARIIFIVGRESNVRKVSFQNGAILAEIGNLVGFKLICRQERKFTNKFGVMIYEDIMHFKKESHLDRLDVNGVRDLATKILLESSFRTNDASVLQDIESAVKAAATVTASPIYHVNNTVL